MRLLVLILAALVSTSALAAKDGELDTAYGGVEFGRVRVSFDLGGSDADTTEAIRVLPDGRTVVVGFASAAPNAIAVAVRLPNGRPDTSLGPSGKYTLPFSAHSFSPFDSAFAIAADGSFFAIGIAADGLRLRVRRYALDGALLAGPYDIGAAGRAYEADRAIVIGGPLLLIGARSRPAASASDADWDATLLKMTLGGQLDSTFGNAGTVALPFDPAQRDDAWALADVGDNSYVVCSRVGNLDGSRQRWGIAHVSRSGALVTAFGGTGMIVDQLNIGGLEADSPCNDIDVLNTGTTIRYIMTGRACPQAGPCQAFVIGYQPNGDILSGLGPRMVDFGQGAALGFPLVRVGRDTSDVGRIYLAEGSGTQMLVTRLTSVGSDDTSFGTGGVTAFGMSVPAINGTARVVAPAALEITPRGLHVAGLVNADGAGNYDFALFKLQGNTILSDGFE